MARSVASVALNRAREAVPRRLTDKRRQGKIGCLRTVPVFLFCCTLLSAATALAQSTDRAAVELATQAVYPSLVRVAVVVVEFAGGREVKHEEAGSGTIITSDGFVVTNHHVAGHARRIICTLPTKEEMPADLIGTDPMADIAVIKLHPDSPRTFPAARFGDSSALERGDPVLAMGSPFALSQSVTRGIVSNTEMIMPQLLGPEAMSLDGEDVGTIVRWIGHDAPIYPGNSGGPLVSLDGQIVGINELSLGLSGAIPSNLVKPVVEELIRTGHVRRSWPGFEVQPLVAGNAETGALISWVADGSPAARAGIRAGDLLIRVNDTLVRAKFAEELPTVNQILFGLPIGTPSMFVIRRNGIDQAMSLVAIERPQATAFPEEVQEWGIAASDLSFFQAREMGRSSSDGVRVVSVRSGGPAEQARPSLIRDDVIVAVDNQPVKMIQDLEERTAALLKTAGQARVLVAFDRQGEHRLTVIALGGLASNNLTTEASKAWLGVDVQALTPQLADRLGLLGRPGARVTRVNDVATTLRVGDVILAVDDDMVHASSSGDDDVLAAMIREHSIGSRVVLTVSRGSVVVLVPVTLATAPPLPREMKAYNDPSFEFLARDLAAADRADPKLTGTTTGVVIDSVTEGGWAAVGHLLKGDVIIALDGAAVTSVDDLSARLADVVARRPSRVVFEVRRGIRTLFVAVQPTWK
jgi:serine protease Do